jgi:aminomethyltransferase
MQIRRGGTVVGRVTSGCLSPTLDRPIAMAFVDAALAEAGTEVEVDLRGTTVAARVEPLPFYRRG